MDYIRFRAKTPADESSDQNIEAVADNVEQQQTGRGHRIKKSSSRLADYITHTVRIVNPTTSTTSAQSQSSGTPFPLASYINYDRFSANHTCFLASITSGNEPISFNEAVKDPGWLKAMKEEIDALEHNGTWTLEHLPPGKRAIGCK